VDEDDRATLSQDFVIETARGLVPAASWLISAYLLLIHFAAPR